MVCSFAVVSTLQYTWRRVLLIWCAPFFPLPAQVPQRRARCIHIHLFRLAAGYHVAEGSCGSRCVLALQRQDQLRGGPKRPLLAVSERACRCCESGVCMYALRSWCVRYCSQGPKRHGSKLEMYSHSIAFVFGLAGFASRLHQAYCTRLDPTNATQPSPSPHTTGPCVPTQHGCKTVGSVASQSQFFT